MQNIATKESSFIIQNSFEELMKYHTLCDTFILNPKIYPMIEIWNVFMDFSIIIKFMNRALCVQKSPLEAVNFSFRKFVFT